MWHTIVKTIILCAHSSLYFTKRLVGRKTTEQNANPVLLRVRCDLRGSWQLCRENVEMQGLRAADLCSTIVADLPGKFAIEGPGRTVHLCIVGYRYRWCDGIGTFSADA